MTGRICALSDWRDSPVRIVNAAVIFEKPISLDRVEFVLSQTIKTDSSGNATVLCANLKTRRIFKRNPS